MPSTSGPLAGVCREGDWHVAMPRSARPLSGALRAAISRSPAISLDTADTRGWVECS